MTQTLTNGAVHSANAAHPASSSPDLTTPLILFRKANVVTGDPDETPYVADVLVSKGLITRITRYDDKKEVHPDSLGDDGATVVDAEGWILCPGFIDLHAHSDLYLLTHPDHTPKVSQGITTEVIGQDGISYAPIHTPDQLSLIRNQIAGWNGNPTKDEIERMERAGLKGMFAWNTLGEFLDILELNRPAVNVAMLVPQGNLRLLTCGPNMIPADAGQIEEQKELLRQAMNQGAIGMSSGLTYTPGMYASSSELASLCTVLSEEYPGSYYAPHHRSYGLRAIESYQEMLDLGQATGCPVHLTHATLNFPENRGKADTLLSMIDQTRSAGTDITLDTYPYLPGCTTLAALLPSWATAGGPAETLRRLDSAVIREKIRVAVEVTGCDGGHGIPTNWAVIQVGTCYDPSIRHYTGRRVLHIARDLQVPPIQIFFDILQKEKLATSCIMHIGNEENVRKIMCHPTHCGGTDAILHGQALHPRAYGTFPRFIGHYARDLGLMSVEEMIPHLTSRPAKRMGIYPKRGYVGEGSFADLVLFDPARISDTATYEKPREKCKGIEMVLVNGRVVYANGEVTGVRAGQVLRRRHGKVA